MSVQTNWHRLFGLSWEDFLHGQPVKVETELDLSKKLQLLDVALIRTTGEPITVELPDGFDDFGPYNIISFKSHQEKLDGWAVNELVGHYVNYRKRASPDMNDLLPETDFRVYAVCARYPRELASQVPLTQIQEGVYELRHFTGTMRIIAEARLPESPRNAALTCSATASSCGTTDALPTSRARLTRRRS